MTLAITPEPWGSEVGQALVRALDTDLNVRYAHDDMDTEVEPDRAMLNMLGDTVTPPQGVFLVAWLDGVPVGCGAVRRHDELGVEAEVKRMFVGPEARGRGVARALLTALEDAATGFGYTRLVLETGVRQSEAMALYESAGWTPIPAYGAYRHSPLSRCYEKLVSR